MSGRAPSAVERALQLSAVAPPAEADSILMMALELRLSRPFAMIARTSPSRDAGAAWLGKCRRRDDRGGEWKNLFANVTESKSISS